MRICDEKSDKCLYDDFKNRLKHFITNDIDQYCGNKANINSLWENQKIPVTEVEFEE